jgi:hypothetical protein
MEDFSFFDYDNSDIAEAVEAVTGDTVVYTSIDDEHAYWFVVEDEDEPITYENPNVEGIDELYPPEVLQQIEAYLVANYKPN